MNKQIVIYCVIISLIASAITPIFTLVTYIPDEGEMVYDFSKKDDEKISKMSWQEMQDYVTKNVRLRRLTGFERITYLFSRPSMVLYHKGLLLSTFFIVFISTLMASWLTASYFKKQNKNT